MAGEINSGSLARFMRPGLHDDFGLKYVQYPDEWRPLFEMNVSHMGYEEEQMVTTMGLPKVKTQGGSLEADDIKQSYGVRYTHVEYGLSFIVTEIEIEDNLYLKVADFRTAGLAFSMKQGKNHILANIFNFAFTAGAHAGGDGVAMLSATHPTEYGNQSNILPVAQDLSESSLEECLNQVEDCRDNRGKKIGLLENMLLIPHTLQFDASRILRNPQRPGTADRDINAMYVMDRFPAGVVKNHFLTNPKAWFVKTNCPNSTKYFERRPLTFSVDNDMSTKNLIVGCAERYSAGCSDWRGWFGSPGA